MVCPHCSKTYSSKWTLSGYIKQYHAEKTKPFGCTYCEFRCATAGELNIHVRKHTGERPYACPKCPLKFVHLGNARRHDKIVHNTGTPFDCQQCTDAFRTRSDLRRHINSRHALPRKIHSCSFCAKKFATLQRVRIHMRTHTGEKLYVCNFLGCQRAFAHSGSLKAHQAAHTDERPHECQLCRKGFKTKGSLRAHVRNHSEAAQPKLRACPECGKQVRAKRFGDHVAGCTDDRKFECSYCEKKFAKGATLNLHLRTHTGEKPYGCRHCPATFWQNSHLHKHLKTIHAAQ